MYSKQILDNREPHKDPNDRVSCESDFDCKDLINATSCNNETQNEIIPGGNYFTLELLA